MSDEEKVSIMAIGIPRDAEAVVLTEETVDTYAEWVLNSITPSLHLFILSDPPASVRVEVIEGLVANGIGSLLHVAMLLNGAPLPEALNDPVMLGRLAQEVQDAAVSRIPVIVAEMIGELGGNDD